MKIRFSELLDSLEGDPFYGIGEMRVKTRVETDANGRDIEIQHTQGPLPEDRYPVTKVLIAKVYSENARHQLFEQFRQHWNRLPCKDQTTRHLGFIWCGMMGLPTYKKSGERSGWEREDFLDNWREEHFFIELDELADFLTKHQLPFPYSLYPGVSCNSFDALDDIDHALNHFLPNPQKHHAETARTNYKDVLLKLESQKCMRASLKTERAEKKACMEQSQTQNEHIQEQQHLGSSENNTSVPSHISTLYIAYPKALGLLANRLDAKPEEIAAWVWFGAEDSGLDAYINANELAPPPRFYYGDLNSVDFDYLSPLIACWFLEQDIVNFKPTDRYITGEALIKRWEDIPGIQPEAFIQAKIEESRLADFHPIFGLTQGSITDELFPPLETGLFSLSNIMQIEAEDFCTTQLAELEKNKIPELDVSDANVETTTDSHVTVDKQAVEHTKISDVSITFTDQESHPDTSTERYILKRCPGGWAIGPENNPTVIRTRIEKGYRLLGHLLIHPNKVYASLDLKYSIEDLPVANQIYSKMTNEQIKEEGLTKPSSVPYHEATDTEKIALKEYKSHIQALEDKIMDAEECNDVDEVEKHKYQKDLVIKEIRRFTSRKGMLRDDTSDSEKARKAIQRAIKRAVDEITNKAPEIAKFIGNITLGLNSTYMPSENDPIWIFSEEKEI